MPLGYDCRHATPTTVYDPRYCSPAKRQRGHPATGYGDGTTTSRLIIGTGTPPAILLQQSAIGVTGVTGYRPGSDPYDTGRFSRSSASFVNDAGSFFAGGGPAAHGTVTKTSMYTYTYTYPGPNNQRTGTWRIYPGKNAFGGAMGLLGQIRTYYRAGLHLTIKGKLPIIPAIGHPLSNTIISYGTMGTTYFQNPFATRFVSHFCWFSECSTRRSYEVLGSATLWTTGRVLIRFQQSGIYFTYPSATVSGTGYDNRTAGGLGNIQLVTPTLVHDRGGWAGERHTAQIGVLTIQVPEPWSVALLITGLATLCGLYRLRRR
jgi:hypothetical protein